MNRKHNVLHVPPGQSVDARMPVPEVYEQEYNFWPWGNVLNEATKIVVRHARQSSCILDYMCGTGFLLDKILSIRNDLSVLGCDIHKPYVNYARVTYPTTKIACADARFYKCKQSICPDFIICTGGLHHLNRGDQPCFIEKVSDELRQGDFFLLGEEVIRDYRSETERKSAVWEMFSELMRFLARKKPPTEVIQAATDMFVNDWCERGEYKTTHKSLEQMLRPSFEIIFAKQIWPQKNCAFGDWLFLCQRR